MQSLLDRFCEVVARLGGDPAAAAAAGPKLLSMYAQDGRAYHNTSHLVAVLQALDWSREALRLTHEVYAVPSQVREEMFDVVALALFYHDAVYDARAKDNELQSRVLFEADAKLMNLPEAIVVRVSHLIDLTASHTKAKTLEEKLMADCDLSILGASKDAFKAYDDGIRAEYAHVPDELYGPARRKVMKTFADQQSIFKTRAFYHAYETAARANLDDLLNAKWYYPVLDTAIEAAGKAKKTALKFWRKP